MHSSLGAGHVRRAGLNNAVVFHERNRNTRVSVPRDNRPPVGEVVDLKRIKRMYFSYKSYGPPTSAARVAILPINFHSVEYLPGLHPRSRKTERRQAEESVIYSAFQNVNYLNFSISFPSKDFPRVAWGLFIEKIGFTWLRASQAGKKPFVKFSAPCKVAKDKVRRLIVDVPGVKERENPLDGKRQVARANLSFLEPSDMESFRLCNPLAKLRDRVLLLFPDQNRTLSSFHLPHLFRALPCTRLRPFLPLSFVPCRILSVLFASRSPSGIRS